MEFESDALNVLHEKIKENNYNREIGYVLTEFVTESYEGLETGEDAFDRVIHMVAPIDNRETSNDDVLVGICEDTIEDEDLDDEMSDDDSIEYQSDDELDSILAELEDELIEESASTIPSDIDRRAEHERFIYPIY